MSSQHSVNLQVKRPLFIERLLKNRNKLTNLIQFTDVKLHKILPVGGLTVPFRQAERPTDRHDQAHSLCTHLLFERSQKTK
jgi:hypothetical protein